MFCCFTAHAKKLRLQQNTTPTVYVSSKLFVRLCLFLCHRCCCRCCDVPGRDVETQAACGAAIPSNDTTLVCVPVVLVFQAQEGNRRRRLPAVTPAMNVTLSVPESLQARGVGRGGKEVVVGSLPIVPCVGASCALAMLGWLIGWL